MGRKGELLLVISTFNIHSGLNYTIIRIIYHRSISSCRFLDLITELGSNCRRNLTSLTNYLKSSDIFSARRLNPATSCLEFNRSSTKNYKMSVILIRLYFGVIHTSIDLILDLLMRRSGSPVSSDLPTRASSVPNTAPVSALILASSWVSSSKLEVDIGIGVTP